MTARICLLISDDPDDHIEFTEALNEISNEIVLLTVADPEKAITLLARRLVNPEYIFLNLEMNDFTADDFLDALASNGLEHIEIIAYGEYGDFDRLQAHRITAFLNSEMGYSDLTNFFAKLVSS